MMMTKPPGAEGLVPVFVIFVPSAGRKTCDEWKPRLFALWAHALQKY